MRYIKNQMKNEGKITLDWDIGTNIHNKFDFKSVFESHEHKICGNIMDICHQTGGVFFNELISIK